MKKTPRGKAPAQPHDGLAKWTFSQLPHAAGLLKAALPAEMVAAVDWSTLRVEKGSFVDRALRHRHSDIVLSAKMGAHDVLFYAIIEHQRKVDPLMIFRIGLYMWRLWEQLVREKPTRTSLPPIVPFLLHHSDTGWTAATAFERIIDGPGPARAAIERHIPHFELRLVDLSEGKASRLAEQALTALGRLVLWCMSVAYDDERFEREIQWMRDAIVAAVKAPDGHAALEVLMQYLVATHKRLSTGKIGELLIKAAGPEAQEDIVDFREPFKLEGKIEGRLAMRVEVLLDLLAARFGKVPAAARARVCAADEKTLSKWTLRVLTAETVADVLDGGASASAPRARSSSRRQAPAPSRKPERRKPD